LNVVKITPVWVRFSPVFVSRRIFHRTLFILRPKFGEIFLTALFKNLKIIRKIFRPLKVLVPLLFFRIFSAPLAILQQGPHLRTSNPGFTPHICYIKDGVNPGLNPGFGVLRYGLRPHGDLRTEAVVSVVHQLLPS
jgi:hypothetical protein